MLNNRWKFTRQGWCRIAETAAKSFNQPFPNSHAQTIENTFLFTCDDMRFSGIVHSHKNINIIINVYTKSVLQYALKKLGMYTMA